MIVSHDLQDRNFSMVLDVLTRFKSSEIGKTVSSLDNEQRDILMKYIYRGFAEPTENSCGTLLVWHEKVCIVTTSLGIVGRDESPPT